MPDPSNAQIAAAFDELGDLYELDGAIVHRVVAYRNAAKAVREAPVSIAALTREGKVTQLPGIGKTLEEKISALLETGTIPAAEKLRAKFPPGLVDMTRLPGVGPKRVRKLFDQLGIASLDALREAAEQQQLRDVKGFGPKFEETVLAAFAAGVAEKAAPRTLLHRATDMAAAIVDALQAHPSAGTVAVAGGVRRLTESVKDLDVIATSDDPAGLAGALGELDLVESCSVAGEAGARARTHTGMPIDLRVVAPDQLGNLLQHFTGSKAHNVRLREMAVRKGLHVSEYGVLDDATGTTHRCATEEEVYALLGLPWIAPELREDRGELDAGFIHPELVTQEDLRGDLHCHTIASDGRATIEGMAHAAQARGLEYLCITDHSATHGFGNDVPADELLRQVERVREVDASMDGFTLLIGTETNILPDGRPDYDDDVLAQLDWVVGSVHTQFQMGEAEMTKRIVAALEHPMIDCLGHPTGRLIERREGYTFDLDAVLDAARRTGSMLEINGNPNRRDLRETHARAAAQAGIPIVINSDAHGPETLDVTRWGVATARRAWLTKDDVVNTLPWRDFAPLRKRAR
ncbi:DNA polymerase/3'-5' exonuclease PolX [Conexibacter sp. SYSU D00693]|uniref:DNA polymerase/3'-5' exonuclease PolX n=1 Tax=Conexibacter sp. SYSU D00693 TaxID=2812560 RepID=UPI00196AD49D|nr:DNA polymerase/3'-5' exonuclease PolX [Conexibacter sp. SYSU D00693]